MTMFGKGTWTVFKIKEEAGEKPIDVFQREFSDLNEAFIPVLAISRAIADKTTTVGLAPFSHPRLGDEEDISIGNSVEDLESALINQNIHEWTYDATDGVLTSATGTLSTKLVPEFWVPDAADWEISSGVYGAWMMVFEYTDNQDSNSKKERMAYDYGAPFKLQSGEIKKQITEAVADVNALTRKHFQLVLDFNQGLVWLNSAGKPVIEEVMRVFDRLGLVLETPDELVEDLDADTISEILNTLYGKSEISDECLTRLAAMKLHGAEGVEPHENATMEKILKAFYAFSESDGYHIGLSTPAAILLNPNLPSPTGARSVFEATELLQTSDEAAITETGLMFTEYEDRTSKSGDVKRVLSKKFSIQATPNLFHKELPGLIIKGVNVENFKFLVKQHAKATDAAPTIKEYWAMYYDAMKTSVYTYFSTLKSMV